MSLPRGISFQTELIVWRVPAKLSVADLSRDIGEHYNSIQRQKACLVKLFTIISPFTLVRKTFKCFIFRPYKSEFMSYVEVNSLTKIGFTSPFERIRL